jgi:glycosyltransferase involved in cell wall biosynthesis
MTKRPTISLCVIAKNEEKNVRRFLDSWIGAVDEIIFVDTGSTDKTVEIATEYGCSVHHFEWVNSFCKARNFSFSKATKDYMIWSDLDDCLFNKENFINWRNTAMQFADCWLAAYHYALDEAGKPIISFARERVFKRDINPVWNYDLHEGVMVRPEWKRNYATTWAINHHRDAEDVAADKSRNIKILETLKDEGKLDTRLEFYYGKELYEAQRAEEAVTQFEKVIKLPNLEAHDRLLAYQYGAYASMTTYLQTKDEFQEKKMKYFEKIIDFCLQGLKQDPNRAELHVALGDAYLTRNELIKALPCFSAAKNCLNSKDMGMPYEGATYSFLHCYGENPAIQLARIYFSLGKLDEARAEAEMCIKRYNSQQAKDMLVELDRLSSLIKLDNNQKDTSDIVITTPPQVAYDFDEELYKTKGMGGSETALIEIAAWLKKLTNRSVKVFLPKAEDKICESGVEYLSNRNLNAYFSQNRPHVHIAWRHNIKVTQARTYLWCHDLFTPGVETVHNFDKFLALSNFHKNYTIGLQGVPEEKIIVTRNGLTPSKFKFERKPKNPNKFVWMSSPDRGLERCIYIVERVRQEFPDVELHVYYGIEGLYKYGPVMSALADKLKAMMSERPWIKYHGFTEQSKMYQEVSDAVVWCHPNDFIETYCITAIECLANGIFPVVRRLGALQDTLKEAEEKRQAILLDYDWNDVEYSIKQHADACCRVLLNKQWENIDFDIEKHSWESVAKEWKQFMEL